MSTPEIKVGDRVRAKNAADGVVVSVRHFQHTDVTEYRVRLDDVTTPDGEPFHREDLELLMP
jgi:hypothetical protein